MSAFVGVGRPEVERDRRDLEPEPGEEEQDGEDHRRFRGVVTDHGRQLVEAHHPGEAEEEGHAEEHHRRRQHAEDEVLERRLVGADVALPPPGQQVEGAGGQLEPDEEDDEVAARRHHHRAEQRREDHQVVLALPVAVRLDVRHRHQQHDVGADQQQALQREGEAVDDERAVEHRPGGAFDGQEDQRDGRQGGAGHRQRRHPELLATGQEKVEREHPQQGDDDDDLRRQGEVIDRHCYRLPTSDLRLLIRPDLPSPHRPGTPSRRGSRRRRW